MKEKEIENFIAEVKQKVVENIEIGSRLTDEEVEDTIADIVFSSPRRAALNMQDKQQIIKQIFNSIRRLDVLQPYIDDKSVTEIMVNGYNNIFIEKYGQIIKLDAAFSSKERLEDVIQSIVSKVNRSVNEASPIVDARLEDGSRVSIVLPPIALNGPILTIRRFPEKPIQIQDLIQWEAISSEAAEFLELLVKAKYNIFICGGTGSGKTTFLNVLSNFIPKDERIITIEDSAELQIQGIENIVQLETRNSNTEGKGSISIRDLIKCSLRMRPERIIVGEVRGIEALDMLQAMNTGHDGSLSTGHANSAKDMFSRLETMVLSGAVIPIQAVRQQIASAIDIIVHLSRLRDKSRRVMEISEIVGYIDGEIQISPIFAFEEQKEDENKRIIGSLVRTKNPLQNTQKLKLAGISWRV